MLPRLLRQADTNNPATQSFIDIVITVFFRMGFTGRLLLVNLLSVQFLNFIVLCTFLLLDGHRAEAREFVLGWELPWNATESPSGYHCLGPRTASALPMALEQIYDEGIIGNHTITYEMRDSKCDSSEALGKAIELIMVHDIDAMMGPPCPGPCYIVSALNSYWDLVMTSWFCVEENEISNKTLHPFTARTIDPVHKWSPLSITIMEEFGWTTAAIITEEESLYGEMAAWIEHDLKYAGLHVSGVFFFTRSLTPSRAEEIMADAKKIARIIFTIVGTVVVLDDNEQMLMYAAYRQGMTNGDFVFINFELYNDRPRTEYWIPTSPMLTDKGDELLEAYAAMLHVTFDLPWRDGYGAFMNQIIPRMAEPPFYLNVTEYEASVMAGYLYDAMLLYAYALNRTMEYGQSLDSPNDIAENMRDFEFQGATGRVVMDDEGDRRSLFVLRDLKVNPNNRSVFSIVAYLDGSNYTFEMMENTEIDWPGSQIPRDTPRCGFHGEHCWGIGQIIALAVGIVAAVIAMIIAAMFAFRYHREAVRKRQWLLNPDDLQLIPSAAGASDFTAVSGLQSHISKFKLNRNMSHPSAVSSLQAVNRGFHGDSDFALAIYNAQTVAVKRIQLKTFTLTSNMKKELTRMRQITHDSLNRFIGICVPDPKINDMLYYVTEYCPKGSLMDILENDDIRLDMTFKFSFMEDLARGMYYLHSTEIKSHGMLKSSLCLIDSRWVLKVADYGLIADEIDRKRAAEKENEARFRGMLWTAPELLRKECPAKGSQKGDVYSYGIILQEILTRTGPYPTCEGSPKDIIRRVMKREDPPFRPSIMIESHLDITPALISLMSHCWEEKPEDRPDFYAVRQKLRSINKGKKRGLMDNMVLMLEKYTENLESIVAERTSQLVEEKRKTDQLLYRMLPAPVAEQLKRGSPVVGEYYEQVTIYFSDIVGFTTLSAASTPMDVVDFLNDLYICFDDIISHFGVYKIETIGDAYMVVSGLPERNGNRHAGEIANMALSILDGVRHFTIRHRPKDKLQVRIGINSGPVAAGVVGLTMPRYCLFGDAVNTASRMESHGEPLKIHINNTTKTILDELGGYITQCRGKLNIKGKGDMITHWLLGKQDEPDKENNNSQYGTPEKKLFQDKLT
ncbi:atrial natriuretic peptide receptor 2-like isoform X2 [Ptychodera flava]|uniref:atrial natriuretic peptide receptor 2-like isoform X2 n=1 Tax=Ptychodera flava TaxID=63121 RepID=UPI00396A9735